MSKVIIFLCVISLAACSHIRSSNVYDISCTKHGKENYISSCKLGIEAENLGKLSAARCYGEVTITNVMEDKSSVTFDYGFLQSYKFDKQINPSPKIYAPAIIYFPVGWQIINVEKNWSICEKQY
jgi:hypothetical protein